MDLEILIAEFQELRSFLKSPLNHFKQKIVGIFKSEFLKAFTAMLSAQAPAQPKAKKGGADSSAAEPQTSRPSSAPPHSQTMPTDVASPEINAPRPLSHSERRDAERAAAHEEAAAEADAAAREQAIQEKSTADALRAAARAGQNADSAAASRHLGLILSALDSGASPPPSYNNWRDVGAPQPPARETQARAADAPPESNPIKRLAAELKKLDLDAPQPGSFAARVRTRADDAAPGAKPQTASERLAAELAALDKEGPSRPSTGRGGPSPRGFGRD